jgi:hypothetical protein
MYRSLLGVGWRAKAGGIVHKGNVNTAGKGQRRICLLVLGMHRSGTSALARVTSLLGADLPKTVMGPGRGNERGHWESDRLVACHDRLLETLGSRWNDWQGIDVDMLPAASLADVKRELSDLIEAEYAGSNFFVLKEPRLCRMAPFYAELLRKNGIEPRFLLPIRNPLAVIESLRDRDGMSAGQAGLLWLRHALDAEFATRDASRAIISYEHLLHDWRPAMQRLGARLSMRWPRSTEDAAPDITAFLTGELQHFAPSRRELAARDDVPEWVRHAYRALLDLEINPDDDAAIDMLEKIRGAFDAASPIFADALQREIDTKRTELAVARADAAAKASRVKHQDSDVAKLRADLLTRDESIGALKGEAAAREAQSADMLRQLAVGEGTIRGLTAQVVAQRDEIARLTDELARARENTAAHSPEQRHALHAVVGEATR